MKRALEFNSQDAPHSSLIIPHSSFLMTTVLIITHSGDNESVESVARAVTERGGRAVRLDTDRFPSEVRLAARYGGGGSERVTFATGAAGEHDFDFSEIGAVWHRRVSVA